MKKILGMFLSIMLLSSCASKKDIYYMQNTEQIAGQVGFTVPKIQVNDILNIKVTAENLEAASIFNTSNIVGGGGNINAELLKITGYLVGESGEINFPVLGIIKVTDKTVKELEAFIINEIKTNNYLSNPVVAARVINAKFTISGEVRTPGTYTFTEQVLTLPQALGYAGDLTINGKRNNILLIREENGQRTYANIDLTKSDFFNSPYYYIKQNDWIYIQPNAPKVASSGFIGNVGTVLGLGSFILTITILLTR
uniref:polysaccharide biosynthesis/export family protein n=1 Tax=Flavobacterium sp. TaxID=239 RepID=UPI00404B06DF